MRKTKDKAIKGHMISFSTSTPPRLMSLNGTPIKGSNADNNVTTDWHKNK